MVFQHPTLIFLQKFRLPDLNEEEPTAAGLEKHLQCLGEATSFAHSARFSIE